MSGHGIKDGAHVRETPDPGLAQRRPVHRIRRGHVRHHPPASDGEHHIVAVRTLRHSHRIGRPAITDLSLHPEPESEPERIVGDTSRTIKGRGERHTSRLPPSCV